MENNFLKEVDGALKWDPMMGRGGCMATLYRWGIGNDVWELGLQIDQKFHCTFTNAAIHLS